MLYLVDTDLVKVGVLDGSKLIGSLNNKLMGLDFYSFKNDQSELTFHLWDVSTSGKFDTKAKDGKSTILIKTYLPDVYPIVLIPFNATKDDEITNVLSKYELLDKNFTRHENFIVDQSCYIIAVTDIVDPSKHSTKISELEAKKSSDQKFKLAFTPYNKQEIEKLLVEAYKDNVKLFKKAHDRDLARFNSNTTPFNNKSNAKNAQLNTNPQNQFN